MPNKKAATNKPTTAENPRHAHRESRLPSSPSMEKKMTERRKIMVSCSGRGAAHHTAVVHVAEYLKTQRRVLSD